MRHFFLDYEVEKNFLYKAYKAFYDKEPDFRKENLRNITIEMHAMAYLLKQYGIDIMIGYDYNPFNYNEVFIEILNLYMPISVKLHFLIGKMLDHESQEFEKSEIDYTDFYKQKINLIGFYIKDTINKKNDPIEALRLLCSIYYTSKSIVVSNATDNQIAECNKCSLEEVIEAKKLNDAITLNLSLNKVNGYPGL